MMKGVDTLCITSTPCREVPHRVVGFNKKPIPMDDNVIATINKQAKEELQGIEFADINMKTLIN